MLNREKLAKDLYAIVSHLFPDLKQSNDLAQKTWKEVAQDDAFAHRVQAAQSSFLVPEWKGNLSDVVAITKELGDHLVVSVDGSQIYPDRHIAGAGCFLLNVGGVVLEYGQESKASFFSEPTVVLPQDIIKSFGSRYDISFSRDFVDLKREELELAVLTQKAIELKEKKPVGFIDGSIIFWPLDAKPQEIKEYFLDKYLFYLDQLYKNNILVAGYISMPKSRELVSLIKLGLCRFTVADCIPCHSKYETFPCKQVDQILDTHVVRFFIKPNQRTTVFYSKSKIVESYPDHLKPTFVYCDVGSEMIRLEVPMWITEDEENLNRLCTVAIDQSIKGRGYPVALAEAHEQAVVKGADREFFYHLLYKIGLDRNKSIRLSEKAIKKRGIGI